MVREKTKGGDEEVLEEEDPEGWYREATALFTAGRYPEAIRVFEKALEARPRDARFLPGLAAAVDRIGSFSHALSLAGQAAAAAPLSPDAWFIKGLALYRRGDYAGAEDAFYQAVALVPDHTEAWFFCGNCFYLSGEVEKSLECFDRVLNISGRYRKPCTTRGYPLQTSDGSRRRWRRTVPALT